MTAERQEKIQEKRLQGKFLSARWEDDELNQRPLELAEELGGGTLTQYCSDCRVI